MYNTQNDVVGAVNHAVTDKGTVKQKQKHSHSIRTYSLAYFS
jgi:hypothetical protein